MIKKEMWKCGKYENVKMPPAKGMLLVQLRCFG